MMRPMARVRERRPAGPGESEQGEQQAGRQQDAAAPDGARNHHPADVGVLPRFGNRPGAA